MQVYVCRYVYTQMCMYVGVCMKVCVYTGVYVCRCVYTDMCMHMHVCTGVFI